MGRLSARSAAFRILFLLGIAVLCISASKPPVTLVSDDVHYAWPYLRLDPVWSGDRGGKITSDAGAIGQEATNMKPALWIDYSNTVEGTTEGGHDGRPAAFAFF